MKLINKKRNFINLFLTVFTVMAFIILSINAVSYLFWPGFLDHAGEINMVSLSYLLYHGGPVYTALDAPERYSLQHGPMSYLIIGGLMHLAGAGFLTAKLSAFLSLFAVCVISWFWFNHFLDKKTAFYLLGFNIWVLLKWYYLFLTRADSLMLLCSVTGVYFATTGRNKLFTVLGVAFPLGILINLKIHSLLFVIAILFLLQERLGWKLFFTTGAAIGIISILPFSHDGISLVNYVNWLKASAAHGISLNIYKGNMAMVLLLALMPLVLSLYKGCNFFNIYGQHRYFILSTAFSLLCIALIGAKHGSGSHHLAPATPLIMYLLILVLTSSCTNNSGQPGFFHRNGQSFSSKISYLLLSIIFVAVILGGVNAHGRLTKYIAVYSLNNTMVKEFKDLEDEFRSKSMTMMIGYGEKDTHKWYNQLIPLLVFAKNPYLLDNAALNDMCFSDIQIPAATIDKLKDGLTKVWLIPKGNSPFSLHCAYNGADLFGKEFKEAFLANYRLVKSTEYFDVWLYKNIAK